MAKLKQVKPLNTTIRKQKTEHDKLQEAAKLLQENKVKREQAFYHKLGDLCQEYGIELTTQLLVKAK